MIMNIRCLSKYDVFLLPLLFWNINGNNNLNRACETAAENFIKDKPLAELEQVLEEYSNEHILNGYNLFLENLQASAHGNVSNAASNVKKTASKPTAKKPTATTTNGRGRKTKESPLNISVNVE